jgi:phosphoserine phosphatase
MQVKLIATKLVVKDGLLTGKIYGNNCYGEEKVRRINEKYPPAEYEWLAAYGDSSGDKAMLAKANTSFYKPFRQ